VREEVFRDLFAVSLVAGIQKLLQLLFVLQQVRHFLELCQGAVGVVQDQR